MWGGGLPIEILKFTTPTQVYDEVFVIYIYIYAFGAFRVYVIISYGFRDFPLSSSSYAVENIFAVELYC